MRFGIALPNFGKYAQKESILAIAKSAEDLGFDSLWVSDHIVIPESHKGFGDVFYEPLTTLSFVAAKTRVIQLGTSVIILPYRNPIVLAKMISTLDVLSGGRVILGVGVGWLKEEFDALRVCYEERGSITDEYIYVLKNLWSNEEPGYRGKYYNFSNIKFFPKPIQKPHPPIWIGGNGLAALRRAITLGNGWHPVGLTPSEIEEKTGALGELQTKIRSSNFVISLRKNLQIYKSGKKKPDVREPLRDTPEMIARSIEKYYESGVSHLVFQILGGEFKDIIHTMEFFSTDIRPYLKLGLQY
ncbi:MAG TPA: LLM class F420-dependent oxidoreductase [Thermodesulfobacteriota bacterium]